MNRVPRILFVHSHPNETTSYYRGVGPLAYLLKAGLIHLTVTKEFNWTHLMQHDILFLMRPADPATSQMAEVAKSYGLKVWIDHDDNFFDVPFSHPEWDRLNSENCQVAVARTTKIADLLTVTTEPLKELFSNIRKDKGDTVHVIPNAVDDFLYPEPVKPNSSPSEVIAWRGGKSHRDDLHAYQDDFVKMVEQGFRLVFMGMKPYYVHRKIPVGTWTYFPFIPEVGTFFKHFGKLNPQVTVVPLEKNGLNLAKSNIAWLEAAWLAGSVAVVPDFFQETFGKRYDHTKPLSMSEVALEYMQDHAQRLVCWENSIDVIKDKFLLSKTNVKRMELIQGIL